MAHTRSQAVALTIATTTQTRSRTRALGSAAVFSSLRPITRAAARPPIQATKAAKRSKSHHRAPKLRSAIRNSASPDSAAQQSASRYRSASSPEAIDQLHAITSSSSSSSSPNPAPKHAVSVPSNSSSSSESLATPQQFSPNLSNDQHVFLLKSCCHHQRSRRGSSNQSPPLSAPPPSPPYPHLVLGILHHRPRYLNSHLNPPSTSALAKLSQLVAMTMMLDVGHWLAGVILATKSSKVSSNPIMDQTSRHQDGSSTPTATLPKHWQGP